MLVGLYVCHKIYCFVARVYIGMSRVRMLHVFPNLYLGLESQVDFADGKEDNRPSLRPPYPIFSFPHLLLASPPATRENMDKRMLQ